MLTQYVAEERIRVEGFMVLYRRYDDADPDINDNNSDRQSVIGSETRQAMLHRLRADTAYSIVVRSFNRHGHSQLSNTVVMTTFPAASVADSGIISDAFCHCRLSLFDAQYC